MRQLIALLCLSLLALPALGQSSPDFRIVSKFDEYKVRHVVFNSTFVPAEVAKIHGIKRSKYESLLNVSLSPVDQEGSLPAVISGTVTNLIQQQKQLQFKEISEENATYYIAPIRIGNEELLHFSLELVPKGETKSLKVEFSQTVYADE